MGEVESLIEELEVRLAVHFLRNFAEAGAWAAISQPLAPLGAAAPPTYVRPPHLVPGASGLVLRLAQGVRCSWWTQGGRGRNVSTFGPAPPAPCLAGGARVTTGIGGLRGGQRAPALKKSGVQRSRPLPGG